VWKRPGVRRETTAEDHRSAVGPAERELIAQRLLEPLPVRQRPVRGACVGELQLAEGELVAVAAPAGRVRGAALDGALYGLGGP
jgi:hypothetical protein